MGKFVVKKTGPNAANIEQLPGARDWMDDTVQKHAYMCFPLSLTNRLGWGISFPEDISFIWDGVTDTTPDHIKILSGEKYVSTARGNATVSFYAGLIFKTDERTSTLTMPVPNLFVRGAQCYTTLISTSFYMPEMPIAWRVTEPNVVITIPAGQPVAAVLPISLSSLQEDYVLELDENYPDENYWNEVKKYGDEAEIKNGVGDWSRMYREAVDYRGVKVGSHETKSIKLKTVTCPFTGQTYEVEDSDTSGHSED
jgi:Family of unknown function (DUF6065)